MTNALGATQPHTMLDNGWRLLFGNVSANDRALRVTFDGWTARVGPASLLERLPERPFFAPAGVLAASLAMSELFQRFASLNIEAIRRVVGLSLWRPDLPADHPDALGIWADVLPQSQWLLGLGHLGNAYAWTLATLPFAQSEKVEFTLLDFDRVDDPNIETCLLFESDDVPHKKTRRLSAWLEQRGFQTNLVERRFDEHFRWQKDEPALALCGFDSNPARRHVATACFPRVIECGLGAMPHNFDTLSLHVLPHTRPPNQLWPDLAPEALSRTRVDQERMARENPGYAELGMDDCGRALLAGKAVGVPFVGGAASSLVVAEAARLLLGGMGYSDLKLNLGDLDARAAQPVGEYSPEATAGLRYSDARKMG